MRASNPKRLLPEDPYADAPDSPFTAVCESSNFSHIDLEVDTYLQLKPASTQQYKDALSFWRENDKEFPHVSIAARKVLPICGSVPSERVFAEVDRILDPTRQGMKPENVSALVTAKNVKKFHKLINTQV